MTTNSTFEKKKETKIKQKEGKKKKRRVKVKKVKKQFKVDRSRLWQTTLVVLIKIHNLTDTCILAWCIGCFTP